MVEGGDDDDFYIPTSDTRNVRAVARTRGKRVSMVTKAYSHKAVEKIMYSKEAREKKSRDIKDAADADRTRLEEEKKWADPASDKHAKKIHEKEARAEEKVRKKLEKLDLYKADMADGHKSKGRKK